MRLVFAAGGGGDVITASVLALKLGGSVGLLPWERFVVDPVPGPLTRSDFIGVEGDGALFIIKAGSRALRGGREIVPQGACVSAVLNREVYAVSPDARPDQIARALTSRFRKITGVDVGGDILACGCERDLRSPLADSFSLAVLKMAEDLGAEVDVAVIGLGADGELDRGYLLERAARVAQEGGFLGYYALDPSDIPLLEKLTESCVTEASKNVLRALKGFHGTVEMRGGAALAYIDMFTPVALRFKPEALLRLNKMARLIYTNNWDLFTASKELRELGFTTEYDLEILLSKGIKLSDALAKIKAERACVC